MRRVFDPVRSVIFNILFVVLLALFSALVVLPMGLFGGEKWVRRGVLWVSHYNVFLARWVMGIRCIVRGRDRIPKTGAVIIAAAHQSYLDPFVAFIMRPDVTALAKKELFNLPIIGPILRIMKIIRVDRQSGKAHQAMNGVSMQVKEQECALLVYPQGTRVRPGTRRKLKSGVFHLTNDSGLDVYAISTNAGAFWTRGFFHKSGTVIYDVSEKLPSGLSKDAFMALVEQKVVTESDILSFGADAVSHGINEDAQSEQTE